RVNGAGIARAAEQLGDSLGVLVCSCRQPACTLDRAPLVTAQDPACGKALVTAPPCPKERSRSIAARMRGPTLSEVTFTPRSLRLRGASGCGAATDRANRRA